MAFKLKVMEELRDGKWKSVTETATAYGISYNTVYLWMRALGFEHLKGRMISEIAGAKKVLFAIRSELKRAGISIGINRFSNLLKKISW